MDIHLIMNVKVALLPAALGAAIKDAPLDGADVPPNDWPKKDRSAATLSESVASIARVPPPVPPTAGAVQTVSTGKKR